MQWARLRPSLLAWRVSRWKYLAHAAGTSEGRVEGSVVARQSPLRLLAPVPKYQPLVPCLQVGEKQSEVLGDGRIDSEHVTALHYHGNPSWPGVTPKVNQKVRFTIQLRQLQLNENYTHHDITRSRRYSAAG